MCLLAILYRVVDDAPVIVAANREEAYARGGTPPQIVENHPRFVGGLDPVAGGTWLGVNEQGLLIAVTNRAKSKVPAQPRSRGLLTRDLLRCRTAAEAARQAARELDKGQYAGCNLLCADPGDVQIVHGGEWLRVHPLPTGIHILATGELNEETNPRVAYARHWLHSQQLPTSRLWLPALKALCAKKEDQHGPAICLRGEQGGTVSSSLVILRSFLGHSAYWHAQGPPDCVPYEDYSHLFQELAD